MVYIADLKSAVARHEGSSPSARTIKEIVMKTVLFKNRMNSEQFYCNDPKVVQTIDGVEYLVVHRPGQDRQFLMRKDALEKIGKVLDTAK